MNEFTPVNGQMQHTRVVDLTETYAQRCQACGLVHKIPLYHKASSIAGHLLRCIECGGSLR